MNENFNLFDEKIEQRLIELRNRYLFALQEVKEEIDEEIELIETNEFILRNINSYSPIEYDHGSKAQRLQEIATEINYFLHHLSFLLNK